MSIKKKWIALPISVLLLMIFTSCSQGDGISSEINETDNGVVSEEQTENETLPVETETQDNEDLSADANTLAEEAQPKIYDNCYEAYLDILTGNSKQLTDKENQRNVGAGKIVVTDVFGDETPELLYIYIPEDYDISERLKIFTYTKTDGASSVFDSQVFAAAGGGGNYCIYLTNEKKIMVYYSSYNYYTYYGFWPIAPFSQQGSCPQLRGISQPQEFLS